MTCQPVEMELLSTCAFLKIFEAVRSKASDELCHLKNIYFIPIDRSLSITIFIKQKFRDDAFSRLLIFPSAR